jgi:peptidoglycan LD-endopeptidase LytH
VEAVVLKLVLAGLLAPAMLAAGTRIELAWPTPNTAYLAGKPPEDFVQPTVSGEVTSGLFGCVRSGGTQFHEGLDLKPVSHDRKGEAADDVFATMAGVVRHVSVRAGQSSYGRYVVIEHPEVKPAVYTLYAHLAEVKAGLKAGDTVVRGEVIARMGRSAGGYAIPKDRAHLHYEIGLMMTRQFQSWYDWKQFGSPNQHGLWNGMNLMGVDALDFLNQFRARQVNNFQEYFARMSAAATVRVATRRTPDFVQRYPDLVTGEIPLAGAAGWEIKVNATGVPFAWAPLGAGEMLGYGLNEVRVVEVNADALKACRCKALVVKRKGKHVPGSDLETMLQLTLGLR